MNAWVRIWALTVMLAVPGIGLAQDETPPVTEGSYTGLVEVEVVGPDGASILSDWGRAEATFAFGKDGSIQITLTGTIDEDGDNGFGFELLPSGEGWSENTDAHSFAMTRDGVMSGEGNAPDNIVTWNGQTDADNFVLETEVTLLQPTANGMDAGTVFIFSYDLDAERAPEKSDAAATDNDAGCSRIEWRLQVSPNLFGGGMDLISVPHCVP